MKINFNEIMAKIVLIFLLGVAINFILGRIEILDGSIWKSVVVGVLSVVLAEVFFDYANRKGNNQ
ncbi:hypothetical protein GNZ12_12300 [Paraburkholderia sp. 1N]|uniref:Uncharacterized protein n=1 Tax=Paraburkholderia solitsugae TaxID=2675748 RepID=A0ABX2BPU6_9BURK|nr:hypothetical protein [Paraburkholderia solitsugae]NPT42085.1 hypothetical protein [Paraburkholderia solitsugae]